MIAISWLGLPAAAGNPSQLMAIMDQLMHSKEGAELVGRIETQAKKAGLG